MKKNRILLLIVAMLSGTIFIFNACNSHEEHATHWDYKGENGPASWAKISGDYAACDDGHQSPIDLTVDVVDTLLPALILNYEMLTNLPMLNNGHTVQINYASGSWLNIGDSAYQLVQFHFHTPSEHTIAGKSYPLEIHLVHKSLAGNLAVIGVMFEEGQENALLQAFWDALPKEADKTVEKAVSFNAFNMLPADLAYYTYDGSLTTPPCSEGVRWIVLKTSLGASKAQIDAIHQIMNLNARPVQEKNGRMVKASR